MLQVQRDDGPTSSPNVIRVRYTWDETTATTARWQQAFSPDEGRTWETNWIMYRAP